MSWVQAIRVAASSLLLVWVGLSRAGTFAALSATSSDFPATSLTIFSRDDSQVIGHGQYNVSASDDTEILQGENTYLDGERDVETERLKPGLNGQAPTLVSYEHSFFNGDGTRQRMMKLDVEDRIGVCEVDIDGKVKDHISVLTIPTDTYAGAAQILFVVLELRESSDHIEFHSFDCVPGPKIMSTKVTARTDGAKWSMYPGDLVMLEIKPDFGLLDFLVAPLVPKVDVWFDPSDKWNYVGGSYDRFYRGPHVLSVRVALPR